MYIMGMRGGEVGIIIIVIIVVVVKAREKNCGKRYGGVSKRAAIATTTRIQPITITAAVAFLQHKKGSRGNIYNKGSNTVQTKSMSRNDPTTRPLSIVQHRLAVGIHCWEIIQILALATTTTTVVVGIPTMAV